MPVPATILLPFACGTVLLLAARPLRRIGPVLGWFALAVPVTVLVLLARLAAHGPVSTPWVPSLGIELAFNPDGLAVLFAVVIAGIGLLVTFYAVHYLSAKERLPEFYAYLMYFMGSMLGVVLSDNLLAVFVFWECTSVSSYLLIGYWFDRPASRYGAFKALAITGFGGIVMLAGILLLRVAGGSFLVTELAGAADAVRGHALYPAILVLIFIGAAAKSAQWPFHIWLPNAMEAPTPISAYLHSATMVKAGLFLVARLWPILSGTGLWVAVVAGTGFVTGFVGGVLALRQNDLKALLAYSTISQLGMIMAALGLGTPDAVAVGLLHILNHAAFKASLFMVVGIIDHECGSRDLRQVGGLARSMPRLAVIAALGSLAMAGLPPFGGFTAKEALFEASLHTPLLGAASWLPPILTTAAAMLTFAYTTRFFVWTFFRTPTAPPPKPPHEAPVLFLAAPAILAATALFLGPGHRFIDGFWMNAVESATHEHPHLHLAWLPTSLSAPLLMTIIAIAGGLFLYARLGRLLPLFDLLADRLRPFTLNAFYDGALIAGLPRLGRRLAAAVQNGDLRRYLAAVILFAIAVPALLAVRSAAPWTPGEGPRAVGPLAATPAAVTAVMIMIGAVCTAGFRNRVAAILALGVTGYFIAVLYTLMSAPDVALTQLLIETVAVILFLLLFYFLPPYFEEPADARRRRTFSAVLAVAAGIGAATVMWIAQHGHAVDSISSYYLANAEPVAGGSNVVNVIIVDFRGFDTLGEISVLALAAIGIYGLLRGGRRRRPSDDSGDRGLQPS